jgi:hypothetical protein
MQLMVRVHNSSKPASPGANTATSFASRKAGNASKAAPGTPSDSKERPPVSGGERERPVSGADTSPTPVGAPTGRTGLNNSSGALNV